MSTDAIVAGPVATAWQLDPTRSSVEFRVRNFYGLQTVKGRFDRYRGTLDLSARPAVELVVDAGSVDTGHAKRDDHLRSADFLDAAEHPEIRFVADTATVDGNVLTVRGLLHAAGRHIPVEAGATVTGADGELEIEAGAVVDQRELGMTWSPLGLVRPGSRLIVRGRLVPAERRR